MVGLVENRDAKRSAAVSHGRNQLEWIGQRLAAYGFRRRADMQPQRRTGNGLADRRFHPRAGRKRPVGENGDRGGAGR
jgi:hypothetical protein